MLTPQEVSSKTFPKAVMGGYGMAAVDDFLDKLTEDYTALFQENTALKAKAKQLIVFLYDYYCRYVERLPEEYRIMMEEQGEKKERVVCDYIAGMSDSYAIDLFEELFVPKAWKI